MSGIFGGGEKVPPPPPQIDSQANMAKIEQQLAEERRKRTASGRASTLIAGNTGAASTASRTLTGNL